MKSLIPRLMIGAAGLFGVLAIAVVGYWFFVQRPADACENSGNWWDPENRVCGTVVYIPDITGRYRVDGRVDRQAAQIPERPAPAQPLPQS